MKEHSLSIAEKEQIQKEVEEVLNSLIEGCETLDMELAFGMFLNFPDFVMMSTDGTLYDYETYLKDNIDYLSTCSSFKLTTFRKEIRVINNETAVCAWSYRAEATLKTGERDIVEHAGASFVFTKIDGEWKVIFYHESSSPTKRISQGSDESSTYDYIYSGLTS